VSMFGDGQGDEFSGGTESPADSAPQERGPFDELLRPERPQIDRGKLIGGLIAALAVLLLVLILPPISILSGGDGGDKVQIKTTARKDMPSLPDGLEAVSPLYDIEVKGKVEGSTAIVLQLPTPAPDQRNLSLFTNDSTGWRRIGSAVITLEGSAVQAELSELPANIAVMRRGASARQIVGDLPPGTELSAEAARAVSALDTVDYSPLSDGGLRGGPTDTTLPAGLPIRPSIRVWNAEDATAADEIMSSPDLRDEHIDAILAMVESGHYDGVNLDYGVLDSLRKDDFSDFVVALAEQLHRRRLVLTLAAPLPVAQGSTWDTGAYDWSRLSQVADAIKLAPESDPSRYYDRMEDALKFLIDEKKVPSTKLLLQISPLGREKGGEGIRALTALEALSIASTISADKTEGVRQGQAVDVHGINIDGGDGSPGIVWDEEAAAVSFTYAGLGGARTIWLENVFSIAFKLELASRFNLGGVAVDDASNSVGQADIWAMLEEWADTGATALLKPNGSLLQAQWETDGGTLEDAAEGSVTWVAPEEAGSYHVTLIVSDGVIRVGQRVEIQVETQ